MRIFFVKYHQIEVIMQKILSVLRKASTAYNLIEEGDKIAGSNPRKL